MIGINAKIKKPKRSETNALTLCLEPKLGRRKKIIRIRAKINEREQKNKRKDFKTSTVSSFFFLRKDKLIARLTKEKREDYNQTVNKKGDITTDTQKLKGS